MAKITQSERMKIWRKKNPDWCRAYTKRRGLIENASFDEKLLTCGVGKSMPSVFASERSAYTHNGLWTLGYTL